MTEKKTSLHELRNKISDILAKGGGYTTHRICTVLDEIAHWYGTAAADEAIRDYDLKPIAWPKGTPTK